MESYAIAKLCVIEKIDFSCFKYVSDNADGDASHGVHSSLESYGLISAISKELTQKDIMDIKDIPVAVLNAALKFICRERIIVSRIIEVIKPLIIAKVIIPNIGNAISLI